jgi:chemotaxis protein CheC
MNEQILTPLQEDYLKELINVSFGLAASIIGDMMETKAELVVPSVRIYPISELQEVLQQKIISKQSVILIKQFFQSAVNGDAYFMIEREDAKKLASMLFKKDSLSDQDIDCLAIEITNILTSACIGQIAQMSASKTIFLPPEVVGLQLFSDVGSRDLKAFSQFIIVETVLNLEKEGIKGEMLILIGEGVLSIILKGVPDNV